MANLSLVEDVKPVSEFRNRSAAVISQVQHTRRPVLLTQHGRGAAVLLDVHVYEELIDELELLREVRLAEAQIDRGEGLSHEEASRRILEVAEG